MQLYCKDSQKEIFCPSNNVFDQNFAQKAFDACGYDFEYIHGIDDSSRDDYLAKIKQSIDNRIPVLCRGLTEPGPEFAAYAGMMTTIYCTWSVKKIALLFIPISLPN